MNIVKSLIDLSNNFWIKIHKLLHGIKIASIDFLVI